MPFSRRARWLLCAMLLAPAIARASEETILVYDQFSQTVALRPPSRGGNVLADTSRTQVLIALGDHRLVVYEPRDVWVYDFAKKRVQRVNSSEHTYSDWSLHAFVAFKEMELAERMATRGSAKAGAGGSVLDLESLFSIPVHATAAGRRESLVDSSNARRVRVWINGRMAVESFATESTFAAGRAKMFDRFLAFQGHVHPRARASLLRSGRIPRQLVYRYRDVNDETTVLMRLVQVASAPNENDPLAESRRVEVDDPEYRELDRRVTACRRCASRGDWIAEARRFEAAAIDSGRFLDAYLARAERVLGGCEKDSAWSGSLAERVRGDTAIAACRAGLVWRDSAGAAAALRRLDRVDGSGLAKGYVLDDLRGRARIAVHDVGTGAYLMMGGLGGNPCMAGSWLDLARGYFDAYQPVLAWICLEAADQAGGGCDARLAERVQRERDLERRYPDLFE